MLLDFVIFDENSDTAELAEGLLKIQKKEKEFFIYENDQQIACIPDEVTLDLPSELMTKQPSHSANLFSRQSFDDKSSKHMIDSKRSSFMEFLAADQDFETHKQFNPPEFGVTVLGCSHGFDPKGSTSGYVFWVNGRFY